jgi:nicotinamidase-related amidase
MAEPEPLDHASSALLLFDFLEGHVNRDAASRERYAPVVAHVRRLLAAARELGIRVVYANADHRSDGATSARTLRDADNRLRPLVPGADPGPLITAGTPQARVIAELAPQASDIVVPKQRWSAFHGTYLDLALRTQRIHTLLLCGGSTDVGIAPTAFARDLDYNLVIVSDGCTSPEQDNHAHLMQRVFPRMARVRTTAQLLGMMMHRDG